jgi:hypothetical protein
MISSFLDCFPLSPGSEWMTNTYRIWFQGAVLPAGRKLGALSGSPTIRRAVLRLSRKIDLSFAALVGTISGYNVAGRHA